MPAHQLELGRGQVLSNQMPTEQQPAGHHDRNSSALLASEQAAASGAVIEHQGSALPTGLSELQARDQRYVWHPFTQMAQWQPLVITRGQGAYLIDEEGRRYLDGVSSLWANVHGHGHPALDEAVRAQLSQLAHSTLLGLSHPPAILLAERLVQLFHLLSQWMNAVHELRRESAWGDVAPRLLLRPHDDQQSLQLVPQKLSGRLPREHGDNTTLERVASARLIIFRFNRREISFIACQRFEPLGRRSGRVIYRLHIIRAGPVHRGDNRQPDGAIVPLSPSIHHFDFWKSLFLSAALIQALDRAVAVRDNHHGGRTGLRFGWKLRQGWMGKKDQRKLDIAVTRASAPKDSKRSSTLPSKIIAREPVRHSVTYLSSRASC